MVDTQKIANQLDSKKLRLERVLRSQYPLDPSLTEAHERKLENAKIFLKELADISYVVNLDLNIRLVSKSTLDKQVEKADFATVDFDGQFCKLIIIQNYPYDDLWLLWVAPVESI